MSILILIVLHITNYTVVIEPLKSGLEVNFLRLLVDNKTEPKKIILKIQYVNFQTIRIIPNYTEIKLRN